MVEECGMMRVTLAHVVFREGATYLLEVALDPYRGPDKVADEEGSEWLLEFFGSGEIEVGRDMMEEDLEALVRRSWEKQAEPGQPPRAERAAEARQKWLRKHGLVKPEGEVPADEPAAAESGEAGDDGLADALSRCRASSHANEEVREFVFAHTEEEPVLEARDPYTIMEHSGFPPEGEEDGITYGCRGQTESREVEVETNASLWENIHAEMETACQQNATQLEDLRKWRQEQPWCILKSQDLRDNLQGAMKARIEQRARLKEVLFDPAAQNSALEEALQGANQAEVVVLDKNLMELASKKLKLVTVCESLEEPVSKLEAALEEGTEEDHPFRKEVLELLKDAGELQKALAISEVPLPEGTEALVQRAGQAAEKAAPAEKA